MGQRGATKPGRCGAAHALVGTGSRRGPAVHGGPPRRTPRRTNRAWRPAARATLRLALSRRTLRLPASTTASARPRHWASQRPSSRSVPSAAAAPAGLSSPGAEDRGSRCREPPSARRPPCQPGSQTQSVAEPRSVPCLTWPRAHGVRPEGTRLAFESFFSGPNMFPSLRKDIDEDDPFLFTRASMVTRDICYRCYTRFSHRTRDGVLHGALDSTQAATSLPDLRVGRRKGVLPALSSDQDMEPSS